MSSVSGLFWDREGILELIGVGRMEYEIKTSAQYSTEEEKRLAAIQYYIDYVPGASWSRIASALWYYEAYTALEAVRKFLPKPHGKFSYNEFHMLRE